MGESGNFLFGRIHHQRVRHPRSGHGYDPGAAGFDAPELREVHAFRMRVALPVIDGRARGTTRTGGAVESSLYFPGCVPITLSCTGRAYGLASESGWLPLLFFLFFEGLFNCAREARPPASEIVL